MPHEWKDQIRGLLRGIPSRAPDSDSPGAHSPDGRPDVLELAPSPCRTPSPPGAGGTSAHPSPLASRAHRIHQLFSLAQDAATSNAALLDRIHEMTESASGGGFASVTQGLVGTTGRLEGHANETVQAIGTALTEIHSLETSIQELETSFALLRERVESVQSTSVKIADIADLSHLLSLNARIEASRAGEEAAGFRVVAQEVGRLAQSTQTLSDEIAHEVSAIGESLVSFGNLFSTNRASLENAGDAVSRLEVTAHGITSDTKVLVAVTRDVEALAHTQVRFQGGFDWLRRHCEWVDQASAALVDGLAGECDAVDRALRTSGSGELWRDIERFRDEMARALRDDLPALGESAVDAAIRSGQSPSLLLQALSEASSRVYLAHAGRDEPLETYYRNGRILEQAVAALEPLVPASFYDGAPVVVMGNAFEDYHDLGRRLVCTSMRAAGFRVVDLGLSVSNDTFVETAIRENADVVGVSSLLLHTAKWIPELKRALIERGRGDIAVIAGGAPFIVDPDMRKRFGADGVGRSPHEAIRLVRHLVAISRPVPGLGASPVNRTAKRGRLQRQQTPGGSGVGRRAA